MEGEIGRVPWTHVLWNPTPGGDVEHVEQHDPTSDDVDYVLGQYESTGVSRSTGRPCVFGHTPDDRYIVVTYEEVDKDTVLPLTACEVCEP